MKLIKHKNTNTISIYLAGALIFLTQFIFSQNSNIKIKPITSVIIGAQQFDKYIPKLKNKLEWNFNVTLEERSYVSKVILFKKKEVVNGINDLRIALR